MAAKWKSARTSTRTHRNQWIHHTFLSYCPLFNTIFPKPQIYFETTRTFGEKQFTWIQSQLWLDSSRRKEAEGPLASRTHKSLPSFLETCNRLYCVCNVQIIICNASKYERSKYNIVRHLHPNFSIATCLFGTVSHSVEYVRKFNSYETENRVKSHFHCSFPVAFR